MIRKAVSCDIDLLARLWLEAWLDGHGTIAPPALVRARTRASFAERLAAAFELYGAFERMRADICPPTKRGKTKTSCATSAGRAAIDSRRVPTFTDIHALSGPRATTHRT